jgi:Ni,Fe-hydrogenase III component G
METEAILRTAESVLQPWSKAFTRPASNRLDAVVLAADLLPVVSALHQAHMGFLSAITGLDHPPVAGDANTPAREGTIEVLYHFCQGAAIVTLRITVPYSAPMVPSVCGILPAATLYERELMELLGVEVQGTPDTRRLVLSDDWPVGVYPLRKGTAGFPPVSND